MTVVEILSEIRRSGCALEVYQELHNWIIAERDYWIDEAMKQRATVVAVRKIATKSENPRTALEGIVNLTEEE